MHWLPCPYSFCTPRPPEGGMLAVPLLVSSFITTLRLWDLNWLHLVLSEEEVLLVSGLPFGGTMVASWMWHFDPKGFHSVHSGYRLFMFHHNMIGCSDSSVTKHWWIRLWKLNIPAKIKILMWRAFHMILPVLTCLVDRRMDISPLCPYCGKHPETITQVVFGCRLAKELWKCFLPVVLSGRNYYFDFSDFCVVLADSLSPLDFSLWCIGCWGLWDDHNDFRVCGVVLDVDAKCWWLSSYVRGNGSSKHKEFKVWPSNFSSAWSFSSGLFCALGCSILARLEYLGCWCGECWCKWGCTGGYGKTIFFFE